MPGVHAAWLKAGLSGLVGIALLLAVLFPLSAVLSRRKGERPVGQSDHRRQ
jgi:hypothetical protein